jgi:hypothetical protein
LSSAEARRSVLDTAAKQSLSDDDYALFSLTMKALKPARDRRNDFAHGIWGTADELPDALLWISADDHIKYRSYVRGGIPTKTYLEAKEEMFQTMFVYTKDDFEREQKEAVEACNLSGQLNYRAVPQGLFVGSPERLQALSTAIMNRY